MERLTEKAVGCFEYALKDHKAVPGEFGTYEAFFDYSMAVKRLGHYEDTGMEPDEIKNALDVNDIIPEINVTVDHIRDLLQAEQEGRLVVLPCKVGDTVYGHNKTEVSEYKVSVISLATYNWYLRCQNKNSDFWVTDADIGRTVYLTREEAEAALAGKGGDD